MDQLSEENDFVTLMTIHTSKGLERENVFIAGVEDGILPHIRTIGNQLELEEERRLMYVAMTRGQEDLSIDLIDYTVGADSSGHIKPLPTELKFIAASDEDCLLHEKVLAEIAKASKKDPVWSPLTQAG